MPRKKGESVSITIELPPETYAQIEQQATGWGETVQEWIMEAIHEKL